MKWKICRSILHYFDKSYIIPTKPGLCQVCYGVLPLIMPPLALNREIFYIRHDTISMNASLAQYQWPSAVIVYDLCARDTRCMTVHHLTDDLCFSCPFDFVKVHDGSDNSSAIIGIYCGQQRNLVLYSSESSLFVVFYTLARTANTQNRGFKGIFEFSESFVKLGTYSGNLPRHFVGTWVSRLIHIEEVQYNRGNMLCCGHITFLFFIGHIPMPLLKGYLEPFSIYLNVNVP